ncbi:hypothetical protein L1987_15966 [Smallanthus sonchifolius]|uniref:Uncharacterized protein n=1 Tax=Smallanthus sonchifolius TaxID=185202 RepID=A0ACB9J9B5_9ASTR|nr:hypothetical protein L1987_15966 [Smallanthus sonchifolius]
MIPVKRRLPLDSVAIDFHSYNVCEIGDERLRKRKLKNDERRRLLHDVVLHPLRRSRNGNWLLKKYPTTTQRRDDDGITSMCFCFSVSDLRREEFLSKKTRKRGGGTHEMQIGGAWYVAHQEKQANNGMPRNQLLL